MQREQDIPSSYHCRVSLYGPLEMWKRAPDGDWKQVEREAWGKGRPARVVFKRLLIAPGRRLSRGRLQEDLWPDIEDFELADKNLYTAINQIRGVLGKTLVKTIEGMYEIASQSFIWVDSDAAELLLKEAENQGRTRKETLPLLEEALTLLERGELLKGESGTWVYGQRKKSEDLLRQCRLWLAESYERLGKDMHASLQYRALLQSVPPDEDVLQQWISMLHRQGKMQEARKCYQDVKGFVEAQGFTLSSTIEQFVISLDRTPLQISSTALNSPFVQDILLPTQDIMLSKQGLDNSMNQLRRKFLQETTVILPSLFLGGGLKHVLALDEIVSHGRNVIRACWHLMKGKEIHTAEELLNAYTPVLLNLTFQASPYQQAIAQIATQASMIRAIIAKHHLNPVAREMYCHEAIQCSRLSDDNALHAGALMYLGYTYTFCNPLRLQKAIETFLEALRELVFCFSSIEGCRRRRRGGMDQGTALEPSQGASPLASPYFK